MRQQQKILLFGFFLIASVGSGFLFFQQWKEFKDIQTRYLQAVDDRETYKAKLVSLQNDVNYLIEDRAQALLGYEEDFIFQSFGVKSRLFEGKKVSVNSYKYKFKTIHSKWIQISEEKQSNGAPVFYGVTVWQFPEADSLAPLDTLAIFEGYENRGNPILLSTILEQKNSQQFTMESGLLFEEPKLNSTMINFEGIYMYSFERGNVTGKPILIKVWASNVEVNEARNWTAEKKEYERRLKEIAETISLR